MFSMNPFIIFLNLKNPIGNPNMFVKKHGLQKLKIRLYTKLVSNLIDFSLFLNSFSLKKPKNTFL